MVRRYGVKKKEGEVAIDKVMELVEKRSGEGDSSFPDPSTLYLYDSDTSWKFFIMLESMSSGFGWNVRDTLGLPWIDVPDELRSDLMTWRYLLSIGENINKKNKANKE